MENSTENMEAQKVKSENKPHQENSSEEKVMENHTDEVPQDINEDETAADAPEAALQKEVKDWQDKYLRLYSEFENFRRRTAKERIDLINNAGEDVIKLVLPVVDDMNRAIINNEKSEDITAVKEGFKLIYNKLTKTLEQKGVSKMEALHADFDSELHEALTKIPAPEAKLKGKVVDVIEDGYLLNGKVVRFAKVVVGE
jgi:molecular chaperone GrpE